MSRTYVAYVSLLAGFAALGMFVYSLATGSRFTGALGAVLVALFAASVVGFRAGARELAASDESGNPIDGANIWAQPLRRVQIDRYLLNYRPAQGDSAPEADETDTEYRYAA
ncbi:MAG: hypothetical protein WBB00_03025 [Mycobacterium sp.]